MDNGFLVGGFMVLVGGALASHALKVPSAILKWIRSRLLFTVDVDSSDPAHPWVKQWLGEKAKCRYVTAGAYWPQGLDAYSSSRPVPRFALCPRGLCWFKYGGKRFIAWVSKESVQGVMGFRETITFQCFRTRRDIVMAMLEEAYELAKKTNGSAVGVWMPSGNGWDMVDQKLGRSITSLVLPSGVAEDVLEDAKTFRRSRDWYASLGIPWRRGYLLHGEPGNGKSSLIHALATELQMNLYLLSIPSFATDAELMAQVAKVPAGNMIVLEDVDASWKEREASQRVTFSGLLNAIDGPGAKDGQIIVMTTNHLDRLDAALVRPGRADVKLKLANATNEQARSMFERFFPGQHGADDFAKGATGMSMARIQQVLLSNRQSAADAVSEIGRAIAVAA